MIVKRSRAIDKEESDWQAGRHHDQRRHIDRVAQAGRGATEQRAADHRHQADAASLPQEVQQGQGESGRKRIDRKPRHRIHCDSSQSFRFRTPSGLLSVFQFAVDTPQFLQFVYVDVVERSNSLSSTAEVEPIKDAVDHISQDAIAHVASVIRGLNRYMLPCLVRDKYRLATIVLSVVMMDVFARSRPRRQSCLNITREQRGLAPQSLEESSVPIPWKLLKPAVPWGFLQGES